MNAPVTEEQREAAWEAIRLLDLRGDLDEVADVFASVLAGREAAVREQVWEACIAKIKETGDKAIGVFSSYPMVEATVASIIAAIRAAATAPAGKEKDSPYKGAISQPCSACSAGDTKMEHHDHDYVKPEHRVTRVTVTPVSQPAPAGNCDGGKEEKRDG